VTASELAGECAPISYGITRCYGRSVESRSDNDLLKVGDLLLECRLPSNGPLSVDFYLVFGEFFEFSCPVLFLFFMFGA